jgi:hypothetical protein
LAAGWLAGGQERGGAVAGGQEARLPLPPPLRREVSYAPPSSVCILVQPDPK